MANLAYSLTRGRSAIKGLARQHPGSAVRTHRRRFA